jgi:hypothetical protein
MYEMNRDIQVQSFCVGNEQQKIVIIDSLMKNPQVMVDFAANTPFLGLDKKEGNYYPGIRLPPPREYFPSLMAMISPILCQEYGIQIDAKMTKAECAISLLTYKPEELSKVQSLPHFDSANSRQFALLHYFCDKKHGGTAFYRHNLTGYETVSRERLDNYMDIFIKDIDQNGPPQKEYIVDSNERFTKIGSVDVNYNRLVIYPSFLLHSACIDSTISVDSNPRTGRLTANAFVAFA